MSVSGISSSSFANLGSVSAQNQSQWLEQFQLLEQQLQSGNASTTAQNTASSEFAALQAPLTRASSATAANANTPISAATSLNPQPVGPAKWQGTETQPPRSHLRHHFRVDAGNDPTTTQESNPLESAYPPGNSFTAQQAYNSWQRDLQQVALNSDLLTAQSASWQPASTSVSISA